MEKYIEYKHLNRSYCYLYAILLLAPILGFILYYNFGWWMFFACLVAYIIQMWPTSLLCLESELKQEPVSIKASELASYVKKERKFQIFHTVILGVATILDLFPFFSMIYSIMGYKVYEGGIIVSIMSLFMAAILLFLGCVAPWTSDRGSTLTDIFTIEEKFNKTGLTPSELQDREINRRRQAEEERRNNEIQLYGAGHIVLDRNKKLYVNEKDQILFIHGTGYKFKDILSYTVQDNSKTIHSGGTSTTKTNTGSMLGRAAVGGALFGNVGAVIGGATASKTTEYGNTFSTEIHHYNVIITVNSISSPMVTVDLGSNQELMNKLSSVLTVILSRK